MKNALHNVSFLSEAPEIDGFLDKKLKNLQMRKFNHIFKLNPENPTVTTSYRLAYGKDFLYCYIEVETDKYICRDRGYQNGDGFLLLLTVPRPGNQPSDEFYLLGCYPTDDLDEPVKKMIWCYNGDFIFTWLHKEADCAVAAHNGTVGVELLLPWKIVYPYHPWMGDIGFDLYFVKAVGDTEANVHAVALDDQEKLARFPLMYTTLAFEPPGKEGPWTYVVIDRNCSTNGTITAKTVTLSPGPSTEKILITIGEKEFVFEYACEKGVTVKEFDLVLTGLPPGQYNVTWGSPVSGSHGTMELSVLPLFDAGTLHIVNTIKNSVSPGSYTSLQFELQELRKRKERLYPYDVCPELIKDIDTFSELIEKAKKGEDVLAQKTGIVRRAFRSRLDNTLQPYTVRIPDDIDITKKYPLLVFLHGSDRDDRDLVTHAYVSGSDFIQVAPCGRGTLNAFTKDNAQADIQEVLEDVGTNYPVDTSITVLAGFSMGGYGAYRTFYETPERYTALAVFSGVPNLAESYFPEEGHPNFLKREYLGPFKDVPIFIFHGKKDLNAPFELTAETVETLKSIGAHVTFCTEEDKGHEPPSAEYLQKYYTWLQGVKKRQIN